MGTLMGRASWSRGNLYRQFGDDIFFLSLFFLSFTSFSSTIPSISIVSMLSVFDSDLCLNIQAYTCDQTSNMCPERDIEKIAKGWTIAMLYSKERLKRIYDWGNDQLEEAAKGGILVLETVCLFVHACVKHGQYQYVEPSFPNFPPWLSPLWFDGR